MAGDYRQIGMDGDGWHRLQALTLALVAREFKGQYRRTVLGPAWALLQPLVYLAVFALLRGVLGVGSDGAPYLLFVYCALVPWTFFTNAVIRSGPCIGANAGILKKMAVIKEVFPLAAVMTSLIDLLVASVVLVGMLVGYEVVVGWTLMWLPVLILMTALLALGIGMGVAALGAFRRDVLIAVPLLMQFWLLATPVFYPLSQVPAVWRDWYVCNPMVGIIEAFRSVVIWNRSPDLTLLAATLLVTLAVWLVAWPLFRMLSRYFADVL